MNPTSEIFVAGHRGLVGSTLVKELRASGYQNLILKTRAELDLCSQVAVREFFTSQKIDCVFLCAAKVGGILANREFPVDFLYQNLMIELNVIEAAARAGVKKVIFLGSSCIYPRDCAQPIKEEYLLSGPLEPTNEAYALAKISGLKLCEYYAKQQGNDFISAMPCNLYGPNDNFDLQSSHVIPALIRKFHAAKTKGDKAVTVWGSGKPLREFLHVQDLAKALLFLAREPSKHSVVNVGTGSDLSIADLAKLIKKIVGFKGKIIFDSTMPDGTPRKVLDISRISSMGWKPKISLEQGLKETYEWYQANGS